MTSEPSRMRRESILLTIALSPLRAIERTRGWRRLGLLLVYAMIAVVILALVRRRSQLAGLPDVGEPFDVAAFRTPAGVSDDRNAWVPYRLAAARFRDLNEAEGNSFSNANLAWTRADATLCAWVAEHDEAISLLCTGAARSECSIERPAVETIGTTTMANNVLAARLSWIGTAALFKAGRLRAQGDPAGAWRLFKAAVRASRHIDWAVPTVSGRAHGIVLIQYVRQPIADWASDPAVSVALLHQALDDLEAAAALAPRFRLSTAGNTWAQSMPWRTRKRSSPRGPSSARVSARPGSPRFRRHSTCS